MDRGALRILLLSYYFPPYNAIGAVRVGKMAKYLTRFGHDVRVVTAVDQPLQPTLPVELPSERLVATRWLNVNRPVELALGGRERVASRGYVSGTSSGVKARLLAGAGRWYKELLHLPDAQVGWVPYATAAASRLAAEWRPDVLYASAMPFSSLLVAHTLSRRFRVPWVAEFRDLWTEHHNYGYSALRRRAEVVLERRVLASASALVTVSEPLAATLRRLHGKPTTVVMNGFDPEDYPEPGPGGGEADPLHIVYTGMVYAQYQDPEPLFQALRELASGVHVTFYGRYLDGVARLAARVGVESLVTIRESVPHREALRAQRSADILLLLLWNDPGQPGVYTGKLFEYLGARRPVLAVGPRGNVAAELIRVRRAGPVLEDAGCIARQLRIWLEQKRAAGRLPDLPPSTGAGLTREDQARVLERVLREASGARSRQE